MNEPMSAAQIAFLDNLKRHALEYLERGWSFFPVSLSSKKPLNEWREYQTRRPTREEVEDWFANGAPTKSGERAKYFNLSVVTGAISGIVILDCDNPQSLDYAANNNLCSPFSVKTTRGMHYYFAHPDNRSRYANKVGGQAKDWPDLPGLDFRGDGGYAILPPSISFNTDGEAKHQYAWEDCPFDFDQMPIWKGSRPAVVDVTNISADEFSFDKLNLATTKIADANSTHSVWEQMEAHIVIHGRLGEGGGRNAWLTKYAGEQVRKGITGRDLFQECERFEDRFFATPLPRTEFERTIQSVIDMDRRNYPSDYDDSGERLDKEKVEATKTASFVYTPDDILAKEDEDENFYVDPVIAPGTITQIVGYNGHGKSIFAYGMCWALANGIDYGPFIVNSQSRVMYFDFETPRRTMRQRTLAFNQMFGNPGNNMNIWNSMIAAKDGGAEISLMSAAGIDMMKSMLDQVQPNVVVIDTVRSAFTGMDEKSPESWASVNSIAKAIRNAGAAVILIHHRNKPGELGLGREAGSTAQLTDIDTQVFVTSVFRKEEEAKKRAALHDSNLDVEDSSGRLWSPYGYLEGKMIDAVNWRLSSVTQIDFGKVRQWTDNHTENYLGIAENIHTGEQRMVATLSPRQKVLALYSNGTSPRDISLKLFIPLVVINQWLSLTK